MRSLVIEHDAWDTVPLLPQLCTISTKMGGEKEGKLVPLKTRLTQQGFAQHGVVDYGKTFAPVVFF